MSSYDGRFCKSELRTSLDAEGSLCDDFSCKFAETAPRRVLYLKTGATGWKI